MFHITLLIRVIRYRKKDRMPRMFLLSNYRFQSTTNSKIAELLHAFGKGSGKNALIIRNELAFVKFIKHNFGNGDFSIVRATGFRGLKVFWRGIIEDDRFIRVKGKLSPYLLSLRPIRVWHSLKGDFSEVLAQETLDKLDDNFEDSFEDSFEETSEETESY